MTEFFERTYYGNTVNQWLTTFLMILGAVILGRALYWFFSKSVKTTIRRNRVRFDDLLLDVVEEPVVLLITVFIARAVLRRLALPANLLTVIDGVLGMTYALLVAWLITRVYDAIHKTYLQPFAKKTAGAFDDQILPLIRKGIRVIVWVVAIIVGLDNAGYNVGTVLAGLGIGGLAVALAAQDTVANVFGGITLFAQKPFLIGDLIEFEGKQYTVKEVGWRATIAEDWDTGYKVTIPNSKFTNGIIANVSAEKGYWFSSTLRLSADLSARQVEQALQDIQDAVCCHPGITGHKVRFEAFGNYAFEFLVLFHVASFDDRWTVITDVNMEVLRRFETHGIRLAGPMQLTVHTDGRGPVAPPVDEKAAATIAAAGIVEMDLPTGGFPQ